MIIDKIEGNPRYLENKNKFNSYLIENPFVARKKGINTYIHSTYLYVLETSKLTEMF